MNIKTYRIIADILTALWIAAWLAAIWLPVYRAELFQTGLFSLLLGLLAVRVVEDLQKGKKDK